MNIDDMTIGQAKTIATMIGGEKQPLDNGMIGKYVIVRCRDAGVHAGTLKSHNGRECVLHDSRRLWYWKPADGAKYLSGVANHGLHEGSKVSEVVPVIHLTENCEIIECGVDASASIQGIEADAK